MGWVKDRQNTQKPKTEKKKNKREQNTPSKAEQLQCAFRFAAIPGLQAPGLQKSMLFLTLVSMKILVRFRVPFGVPF